MSTKCILGDDCASGLARGALPLLALTAVASEALAGGLGITAILTLAAALSRVTLAVLPGSRPLAVILATGTAAAMVSAVAAIFLPGMGLLTGVYLPVMAVSGLVVGAASGSEEGTSLAGAARTGLSLALVMVVLGVFREILGRGSLFGSEITAAPVAFLGMAPGALLVVGAVLGLVRWIALSRSSSVGAETAGR